MAILGEPYRSPVSRVVFLLTLILMRGFLWKIVLIRHGETEYNRRHLFYGKDGYLL